MKIKYLEVIVIGFILIMVAVVILHCSERQQFKRSLRLTVESLKGAESCVIVLESGNMIYCRGSKSGKIFYINKNDLNE